MSKLNKLLDLKTLNAVKTVNGYIIPYMQMEVNGELAIKEWVRLRILCKPWGYYPIIIPQGEKSHAGINAFKGDSYFLKKTNPQKILEKGLKLNFQKLFKEQLKYCNIPTSREFSKKEIEEIKKDKINLKYIYSLIFSNYPKITPYPKLWVGFFPVISSWEVAAIAALSGGENLGSCEVNLAFLKHFYDMYNIEILGYSGAVINFYFHKPLKDIKIAKQLAKELFVYCPDLYSEITPLIDLYAEQLMRTTVLGVWWD